MLHSPPNNILTLSYSRLLLLIISITTLSPKAFSPEILPLFKLPWKDVDEIPPKGQYIRSPEMVIWPLVFHLIFNLSLTELFFNLPPSELDGQNL